VTGIVCVASVILDRRVLQRAQRYNFGDISHTNTLLYSLACSVVKMYNMYLFVIIVYVSNISPLSRVVRLPPRLRYYFVQEIIKRFIFSLFFSYRIQ
jgi:hypothetical protein